MTTSRIDIFKQMLESDPAIRVVGMAGNGGEAVERARALGLLAPSARRR